MNFSEAIKHQVAQYPCLTPQDIYKAAYQATFGCGHLLADLQQAKQAFEQEWRQASPVAGRSCWESLGESYARMHLKGADPLPLKMEEAFRLFAASAQSVPEGNLNDKIQQILEMAQNGELPFTLSELKECFDQLAAQGYPAVHHSDAYRTAYQPHYRVVRSEAQRFLPLIAKLFALEKEQQPVLLAIDGNSGAGKSTLGAFLAALFHASLFHTDDFFLQPAQKTPQRLAQPGGNVDIERFTQEVLTPLQSGVSFQYRPYSCHQGALLAPVCVKPSQIRIVEGSYSLHPQAQGFYQLRVFLSIDAQKQKDRILKRNGPVQWQKFRDQWIPLENRYIEAYHVKENVDFVFEV